MNEIDVLITGSSRPQLFPYFWKSFKEKIHFDGKMNIYYHEDFVFPKESEKVLSYISNLNEDIKIYSHNPPLGLGKSMDYMFKNHLKNDYMFYLQEDWEFERPVELDRLMWVMKQNEEVNFIGLNKIKNSGSLNGSSQPEYCYSGLDMILYHGWSFTPGIWKMPFVRKHWRVREERPEGYFTTAFGDHKTRQDCEYCRKHIGAYMLGKTGEFRYVRHLGNNWRMAKWRLEDGKPSGRHDSSTMDIPYRAPWLGEFKERPIYKG